MMIVEGEGQFEQTKYRIPPRQISPRQILPRQITAPPPYPIETLTTPRPSLEVECPPTPPPSPIPPVKSVVGFQLGSSKFSSQRAITDFLQKALFPDAPPSPPIPYTQSSTIQTIPEGIEVSNMPSPELPLSQPSKPAVSVAKDQPTYSSTIASEDGDSASSKDDRKKEKARKAKPERPPPRGRRKVVATKATTARTTVAPATRTTAATIARATAAATARTTTTTTARGTAARKARPGVPRRKSSSSSNTAVNTAVSSPSNTLTVDVARSLPSASQKQRERNLLAGDCLGSEGKKGDKSVGWVVDPDFRTKYLERKRMENLTSNSITPVVATKTVSTTTVMENVAISTKKGRGKGKNGLVVDEIVPLKGLTEDARGGQTVNIRMVESVLDKEIDEPLSGLVRRKSELTLLFEGAKKAGSSKKVQMIVEGEIRR